jgi:predicted amino acid racemase
MLPDGGQMELITPRLEISIDKIRHNVQTLVKMCQPLGIAIVGVTKVVCGNVEIASAMADGGVEILADSRIENLKRLAEIPLPKMLLRLPMISQAKEVIRYADISLNSEIATIKALSEAAVKQHRVHEVILIVDLGDLREGIFDTSELLLTVEEAIKLPGIVLLGIGTNLTCFGGVLPTTDNLSRLLDLKHSIESHSGINLKIISGGNSSSLFLLENGLLPTGINQLRFGEAIFCGTEAAYGQRITGTYGDCFSLFAEIIEIKDKPTVPIGTIGRDAFGNIPHFEDKGIRRKAICAIGKQDVGPESIFPNDEMINILGASGDHLVLDVTDSQTTYQVGDLLTFRLHYVGILRCMTSEYIWKRILKSGPV